MTKKHHSEYKRAISESGKDIYSLIEIGDPSYWIPSKDLEILLNEGMRGLSLAGLALRTRSKVVKEAVCKALGYPVPSSFQKTQPRFYGQQLDTYVQKAMNLQIWNEGLSPTRRYAIIQVLENDTIGKVRIVNGQQLAILDKTGTVTTKYQARLDLRSEFCELVTPSDTTAIMPHVSQGLMLSPATSPIQEPRSGELHPIGEIFNHLSSLIGQTFVDPGADQERLRGTALHRLVCQALGYSQYEDAGQFPDIKHQLLEIKLQTSPTIDLGLVEPSSDEFLDIQKLGNIQPRHCDTRYAVFYAVTDGRTVTVTHLFVSTGEKFFTRFRKFGGNVTNRKIQIPLPCDFFTESEDPPYQPI